MHHYIINATFGSKVSKLREASNRALIRVYTAQLDYSTQEVTETRKVLPPRSDFTVLIYSKLHATTYGFGPADQRSNENAPSYIME